MSLIVLDFLHNTSVLSFYIDVVLTLSMAINGKRQDVSSTGRKMCHFVNKIVTEVDYL